jgi:uncharacterized protein
LQKSIFDPFGNRGAASSAVAKRGLGLGLFIVKEIISGHGGLLKEPAMKEFLQFVAQQLVNKPSEVDVRETSGGMISILELRVAKEDLGRVIGKQGHTAQSLRGEAR